MRSWPPVAQLWLSRYADRGHAGLLLRIGIVASAVGLLWFAASTEVWQFVAARGLLGAGVGMIVPPARRALVVGAEGNQALERGQLRCQRRSHLDLNGRLLSVDRAVNVAEHGMSQSDRRPLSSEVMDDAVVDLREPGGFCFLDRGVAFSRFPTWMWRNREAAEFVAWLRDHNAAVGDERAMVSFHGLDLYSMYTSRDEVITYLDRIDPEAGAVARHRYACLTPWQHDAAEYGRAVVSARFAGCEAGVVATLSDLLRRRLDYSSGSGDDFLDAAQNAVIVANAERYYRVMYTGSRASWNLRALHMFETLQVLRSARGPGAKIVVWEHNSHVGDASATEMGARGEHNVGMLCRREYGDDAFLVGFGTDRDTVAAASDWGGPMYVKNVRPSLSRSYEPVSTKPAPKSFSCTSAKPGVTTSARNSPHRSSNGR